MAHATDDNQRNEEGSKLRQQYGGQKYPAGSTGPNPYFCLKSSSSCPQKKNPSRPRKAVRGSKSVGDRLAFDQGEGSLDELVRRQAMRFIQFVG